MTTSSFAAGAYASMQGIGGGGLLKKPASAGLAGGAATGMPDFSSLLGKALDSTTQAARAADVQTASVAAGRSDIVDVVTAVAESEAAIETLVAVRDRVIAAYEEIMRMPV
ncbi:MULTISPECIES: flagellar hook-basal body complex protein FliE [Bosea]|jgi:flagellar hook-basal body complex protein FliE|uniref:Flagellar hook-basal body complex protein FliE n=1 Tax=Bosea rubneri TaxID=3075434 RepID=A0ABU3SFG6_9HYPH|nr:MULTISPECIES: flagellar hook-basal body complex protein FliE [unclassified Bosea (in: a-proteobacteria)]KUL95806.1 flagellar hook-basal body protein FliE [Bosea sp. WAO]MDU0343535.1 flagellar hook-basal body complex protein FliE [Bosea sp. ZW T0_25]